MSTTTTPASTSSSAAASSSPSIVFPQAGEMFTCGVTFIHWTYTGPFAPLSLNISNINVAQQPPLTPSPAPTPTSSTTSSSSSTSSSATSPSTSTTTALTKRQYNGYGGSYLPPINVVLATGVNASADVWQWDAVIVPQGWYQILGNVQGGPQASSPEFFVGNGSSTDCVKQFATASTPVSSPSSTSSAGSTAVAVSSKHSNAGAIAGGVIGGIAFLAAAFVAFLYFCLRRRSSRTRLQDEYGGGQRWSQLSFKKLRSGGDVRSSVQQHHSNLPTLDATQTFVGTDEELSTIAHEKAIAATVPPTSFQPVRSRSQRASTQTNASSSSNAVYHTESPVRRTPSYKAQQVEAIPLERTHSSQNYGHPPSQTEPPVSRSGTYSANPGAVTLERTPTGGGSVGPRRKPAPRYDDAEAEAEAEAERERNISSQTTPSSSLGTANGGGSLGDHQVLRHQNSFGAMRPMHVMIPDLPPAVHD